MPKDPIKRHHAVCSVFIQSFDKPLLWARHCQGLRANSDQMAEAKVLIPAQVNGGCGLSM